MFSKTAIARHDPLVIVDLLCRGASFAVRRGRADARFGILPPPPPLSLSPQSPLLQSSQLPSSPLSLLLTPAGYWRREFQLSAWGKAAVHAAALSFSETMGTETGSTWAGAV
jgi:hypothetical protein